jgi:A/G-specific adenine glycosylase
MSFQEALLSWYGKNRRDLPWRKTRDPYRILVSEVMLQQTQVDRVIPKYGAWLRAFPDWKALARASRADVLRLWSGLGYNNRAVRLHALAKLLVEQHDGNLPDEEEELKRLPGIGPYTAGAIMVFAYNTSGMCVDVNVERIMRRIYFSKNKISITKKEIEEVFSSSFPSERARDWGNALMDLGSIVCTTTNPACTKCPVCKDCKSKGEHPDEKSLREKTRQAPFLHSNRWWRGQILKALAQDAGLGERELFRRIAPDEEDDGKFRAALAQLKRECLVGGKRRLEIRE